MKLCDPRFNRVAVIGALLVAIGSGCSFVEMAPGADDVRVVGPGQLPAGCIKRGEVEVSVKDKVGFYERDELRVKDELEVLARNEAKGLDADTMQPKGPPADGAQRWMAFRCGTANSAPTATTPEPPRPEEAQTAPLKDE